MNDPEKIKARSFKIERYSLVLAGVWTIVTAVSLIWHSFHTKQETLEVAQTQARVAYEKDIIYRRWNAGHGGVYVPVTKETQPNPYLSDVPERNITTPSGKQLTLMNPAYMTRQAHELEEQKLGVRGHITSLNPIRPENAPDPWETEALRAFGRGETEINSVEEIQGKKYMRLMRPLITEKGCLKCHAKQGYHEGDIRGGISVSIPMEPFLAIERRHILTFALVYGLLWMVGLIGIGLGTQHLMRTERERKCAEEALQKARDELEIRVQERTEELTKEKAFTENSLNTLKDIFFVFDFEGRFLRWNKAINMVSGYSDGEISSMKPTDFFLGEDINKVAEAIETIAKRGYATVEATIVTKDGKQIPYEFIGTLLNDHEGNPMGISGAGRDITKRKQAEVALRASRELYQRTIDNMLEGCQIIGFDWRYLYVNDAVARQGHRAKEEFLGHTIMEIYPGIEDTEMFAVLRRCMDARTPHHMENEFAYPDGNKGWFELSIQSVPEGIFILSIDITDRKRAEEVLKLNESRLEALLKLNQMTDASLGEITNFVLEEAIRLTGSKVGYLAFLNEDETVLTMHAWSKTAMEECRINNKPIVYPVKTTGLWGEAVRQRKPVITNDYNAPNPWKKGYPEGHVHIIRHVNVPIFDGDHIVIVAGVGNKPTDYDESDIRQLTLLMEGMWRIIQRKQAEEQLKRRLGHITALRNIDMAITSSLDVRVTLNIFLEQVVTQLHVDAASVLLLNPHTQTLEYGSNRGFRSSALKHTRLRLGEGHAGRAAIEQRIVSIPNLAETLDSFSRSPLLANEGFISYYAAPIIAKGNVTGVLEIFHRSSFKPDQEWLDFLEALATQAAIAIDNAELFNNLQRSNIELILAYDSTIEGWSRALDYRDRETEGHSQRVTEMTIKIAQAMGVSEAELVHVRRGALLHDIGKMKIPDNILLKPGPLTDEEWEVMRKHPAYAHELLSPIAFLRPALDIPYCHHEKWDGTGYPRGLKGEQIPLSARIFAVVDVWDALRSDRPYRPAWPEEKVKEYLRDQAGEHFDPQIVKVFLEMEW